jgi:hypothetical protein
MVHSIPIYFSFGLLAYNLGVNHQYLAEELLLCEFASTCKFEIRHLTASESFLPIWERIRFMKVTVFS